MLRALAWLVALTPFAVQGADLPAPFREIPGVMQMQINGLQVRARAFTSSLAPAGACALLKRHWMVSGSVGSAAKCQQVGKWLLLSHPAGRFIQAAQLQPVSGGSMGFLSDFDPREAHVPIGGPRLPLPAGARLVDVVHSELDRDSVFQYTIELPWTVATSLARLRNLARESGWLSMPGSAFGTLDFQRGNLAVRAIGLGAARGSTLVLIEHQPAGHAP